MRLGDILIDDQLFVHKKKLSESGQTEYPDGLAEASLTEDLHFDLHVVILLVNVHSQVMELLDKIFQILRLDLAQVDGDSLLLHRNVGMMKC